MLRVVKRIAVFLAIGAVTGDLVTMLFAPRLLTWFQTPGTGSALCNCADLARQVARGVLRSQLIGALIGAVALALVGELVHHARARRRAAAPPPPPAAP